MHEEQRAPSLGYGVDGAERSLPHLHLQRRRHHRVEAQVLHALWESDATGARSVLFYLCRLVLFFFSFSFGLFV